MEEYPMQPLVQMRDVWTADDVRSLDVGEWWRYEVVDGALVVSPPPGGDHELASADLRAMLWDARPLGIVVVGPIGVELPGSYAIPDLVVTRRTQLRGSHLVLASDILLAVEVVSPGSVTMDRVVKPAKYAAAGVPAYWRVETDPVSLTAYTLVPGDDVYTEQGSWSVGEVAHLDQPFPVTVDLARLIAG
jgi:Uma2 family endonuclease